MLAIIRIILVSIAFVVVCVGSCILCIIRPFHRDNVYLTAKFLHKIVFLLGVKIEFRGEGNVKNLGPVVYICNHQNSLDLFTASGAVLPSTVSVGKKSLKWIPLFGQMYWLTGNILIDRNNKNKAMNTIEMTADKIRQQQLSVWLFAEGTRSYGKGILKLKTGAFRTAAMAKVPLVPICVSNTHKTIKLNRWDNGTIIIEYLPSIIIESDDKNMVKEVSDSIQKQMTSKFEQLNIETNCELTECKTN